jgi:hypothetical protein
MRRPLNKQSVPVKTNGLHTSWVCRHDIRLLKARCETLPAVVYLFVIRANDIPLVLPLFLVALDHVSCVRTAIHDVLALLLASHLDVAVEWLRHGDDVRVGLVPRDWVRKAFSTFTTFDGERPEQSTEKSNEFGLGEVDARASAVAIAERCVATKVGELGQWLLVSWVGGVEESFWLELSGIGVDGFVARDETTKDVSCNFGLRCRWRWTY